MTREELVFETTVLAMDYYKNVYLNTLNEKILKTFREYFELMKDAKVVDKIVINNLATIISTFYREEKLIEPEELEEGYKLVSQLEILLEGDKQAAKNMMQMYSENASYETTESIRTWLIKNSERTDSNK